MHRLLGFLLAELFHCALFEVTVVVEVVHFLVNGLVDLLLAGFD